MLQVPSRRRVIPVEGYDVWPAAVYKPDFNGAFSGEYVDDIKEDFELERKRQRDEASKALKQLLWEAIWAYTKEGLGILGYGAANAASAAAGAVIGAGNDVYSFVKAPVDKAIASSDVLNSLAYWDDFIRKQEFQDAAARQRAKMRASHPDWYE